MGPTIDERAAGPAPRFCGAKNRHGSTCTRYPTPGSRRCHFHGGAKAKIPPGDPGRGGAAVKHGLYAKFLRDPDEKRVYAEARALDLEEEVRVAKGKLAWTLKKHAKDPDGGVVVGVTEHGDRIKPWIEIVQAHLDNLRKLVLALKEIGQYGHDDELETYEEWLKSARGGSGLPPSPSSSEP